MPDLADLKPPSLELRDRLQEAADKHRQLRAIPRENRTEEQNSELKAGIVEINALDAEFSAARSIEKYDLEARALQAAIAEAEARESAGPSAATADTSGPEYRSMGEFVTAGEDYLAKMSEPLVAGREDKRGIRVPSPFGHEYRTLIDSDTATGDGNAGIWRPVATPYAPVPRQMRMFVRDLIRVQSTGLAAIPYIRETNPATNETGASSVAEGVAKPEVVMAWDLDTATVRKLAAWVPVTEEILADAPTLRGYIDTRLTYMLKFREQAEILNGNGVAPDLKGILQFSGVQTQGPTTNDAAVDFGLAIGKIENVDLNADGIVMNTTDFWAMTTLRHSTFFDGSVNGGQGNLPFGAPDQTIWGLPVVRTRALTTTHAIVGDWMMGATLFDREQTTIRTSDSHDTFFVLNKVAILIEERIALAVDRPDAFVNTTIDPS